MSQRSHRSDDRWIVLEIHGWHTECGACGYGRGGWADSPAKQGKPILTPDSRVCPGCGKTFTHSQNVALHKKPVLLEHAA